LEHPNDSISMGSGVPVLQKNIDIEIIKGNLASGEDVLVSDFGKFCGNEKGEGKGRNPAAGEDMMLRPGKVVTFKCSGKLRDKVNAR